MKHKNAEYIIAFANGEEVEWKGAGLDGAYDVWRPVPVIAYFDKGGLTFRMKPKMVTTMGYKRYAWQDGNFEWRVGTFSEGDCVADSCVVLDKEWQYYTFEAEQ